MQYQKLGRELEVLKPPEKKVSIAAPAGRRPSLTQMGAAMLKPAPSVDPGYAVAEAPKRRNSLFGRDSATSTRTSEARASEAGEPGQGSAPSRAARRPSVTQRMTAGLLGGKEEGGGAPQQKVLTAEEKAAVADLERQLAVLGPTIIDQFLCAAAETVGRHARNARNVSSQWRDDHQPNPLRRRTCP